MSITEHFEFGIHTDMTEYERMQDRLLRKGTRSGSRDLFKFWKIIDNISKTVQDRDI